MGVAFTNHLKMPSDLVLVFKTIAMLEGIGLQLDPELNVFEEVEPFVRDALLELQSPVTRLREAAEQMGEAGTAMMMLPRQLQHLLEQVEAGESNLSLKVEGLDGPTRRMVGAANRLVLAILAAAFVVGPALLIPHINSLFPEWRTGAVVLVVAGFVASLLMTVALVLSILGSGRPPRS
jgi:ubiquinone biosynthesis protein